MTMRKGLLLVLCAVLWTGLCRLAVAGPAAIVLAAEDDWFPFTASIEGVPRGLSVDVISEAYALAGVSVVFQPYPYIRCMDLALQATVAGCFNTAANAALRSKYLYGKEPIFQAPIFIYATADSLESGLTVTSLEGRTVGVALDYEYGTDFDANNKIIKDTATSETLSFSKLLRKRIAYVVAYDASVREIIKKNPQMKGAFKIVGTIADSKLYVSFSKSYPDVQILIKQLDDGIRKLKASGRYDVIHKKWLAE